MQILFRSRVTCAHTLFSNMKEPVQFNVNLVPQVRLRARANVHACDPMQTMTMRTNARRQPPRPHPPQANYLLGVESPRKQLHVLCTHRLSADWQALQRRVTEKAAGFPSGTGSSASSSLQTMRRLPPTMNPSRAAADPRAEELYRLSDSDKRFVRECLYPDDAALARYFCQDPGPASVTVR